MFLENLFVGGGMEAKRIEEEHRKCRLYLAMFNGWFMHTQY